MEKCSPVEMRKNLLIVDRLREAGIDFVAVPVINEDQKKQLLNQVHQNLLSLEEDSNN